nr:DNA helicase [Tanacetum cinerariifolium]
ILLEVTTNANTCGNGNKVSAAKSFENQDRLHKKHAVVEAIESNTGRSIGNNVAAVAPFSGHLLIQYDDSGNRNKLFDAEAYKNDNHLHTKQLTDEAIQSMTGLPLGSNCRSYKSHAVPIDTESLAQESVSKFNRIPAEYSHLGQCTCVCCHCGAIFWECKKVASTSYTSQTGYKKCCYGGRIILHMTSVGANVDKSINKGKELKEEIVEGLTQLLDNHNALVQLFRTARNKYMDADIPEFKVRLYSVVGTRRYELPTSETVGAIVFSDSSAAENDFDLIIEEHSRFPQWVNKLHPSYMSLQFPLLFIYGEDGYKKDMKLADIPGQSTKANKRMSMNMYYSYQIHDPLNHYSLLLRGGKLFQQYVVTAYCAIEQSRLDYIRQKQDDIRSEYLSAHAICMLITIDALAICRVHGSPSFFITFTCNAKWPKIEEYIKPFPLLTTADRADIIDRIFKRKVRDYINFVRDSNTFGDVTGEFQKRGLPHCHSLLWINATSRVQQDVDVDKYVCVELPNPISDANTYAVISELMIHGPCGYANPSAACMKDDSHCNRNFPKPYCDKTYIDKDGYVRYRRRDTEIQIQRQNVWLDNRYVVPYNKTLYIQKIDNKIYPTNKAACQALGLLGGDEEWVTAIQEASLFATSSELRKLFVSILIFCNVSDPMKLWEKLQTLPVKKKASKPEIIDASITSSYLWPTFKAYTLMQNMRLHHSDITETERIHIQNFSTWLLHIGDGTIGDPDETNDEDTFTVQMPTELCISDSDKTLATLISFIYDEKTLQTPTPTDLQKKAIVCSKNENADMINAQVLSLVNSQQHVYLSLDEAMPHGNDKGETELLYPLEYLNSLNFANFPPHRLELKVGAPIILLRNLNISDGLCNGTQLIVTQLLSKVIEARIIIGTRISEKVFLPRIPLINRDLNLPFIFKRKQFPIKLCYAMTINKSQGQSLERIGIFLPEHVFACSLSYTVDEIKTMVQKQIEEDKVRQLAIMNLAVEFENASIAKDNLRIAYDECNDIPQEKRVSIDTYLKQESDKDYEMHNVFLAPASRELMAINQTFVGLSLDPDIYKV